MQRVGADLVSGLKTLLAGLIIGTMAVVFAVSKAALIFSGALTPYLSQGIGLVLLGGMLMATIAALSVNCRSVIVQPQDVTAVLLATTAGALVASAGLATEAAFATVVVMVGLSTSITGLVAYLIGHLKLAFIVRFVPRQVTAGFLAASGLLLVREAFTIVAPESSALAATNLVPLALMWPQWLPWLTLGLALSVVVRKSNNGLLIPLAFALAALLFYLALPTLGLNLEAARSSGWLLGPFQDNRFFPDPGFTLLQRAHGRELLPLVPLMVVVVGLCLLGALLNIISLELLTGREADLNRDLKTLGVANLAAGLLGGLPGYHMVGMTGLARRIGMPGMTAGLSVAGVSALSLVFGAGLLSDLPRGLVAAVIWYLGFDLLLAALWDYGRRIPWRDKALVLAIPLVAVTLGVLPALGLGVLAACLIFVFVYAQIDAVRLFTTATHLMARVERSPQERARLRLLGDRIHVYKLAGFLFFGTAHRLLQRLQQSLQAPVPPRAIVVDLKRIVGLDLSAWDAFERLSRQCKEGKVKLMLTGLSPRLKQQFRHQLDALRHPELPFEDDLNTALAVLEEQSLLDAASSDETPARADRDDLVKLMQRHGERREFRAGQTVLREGDASDSLLMLVQGQLDVSILQADGGLSRVNQMLPGALFGEVGYYAQSPRSATVTAAQDSTVWVIGAAQLQQLESSAAADAAILHRALARVVAHRLIAATRLLKDADL